MRKTEKPKTDIIYCTIESDYTNGRIFMETYTEVEYLKQKLHTQESDITMLKSALSGSRSSEVVCSILCVVSWILLALLIGFHLSGKWA